jgi:hypothetical protein
MSTTNSSYPPTWQATNGSAADNAPSSSKKNKDKNTSGYTDRRTLR